MTKRLIEEYLPVEAVSLEASSEKIGGRLGHLSTLHIWWARRPLAAARAAVYAGLTPTPDRIDPENLRSFFKGLCAWGGSASAIDDARRQIMEANDGKPPHVLDMFAGGGAIPLEAGRLGCATTAVELNPVAHLIELCTLDYPQRFGPSLADDVRHWGRWLIERAKGEVGDLYPELIEDGGGQTTLEGGTDSARRVPIAYLWTRTVPCPNPAERPHEVPLVRQTWLAKKKGRYAALRMIPDREEMSVSYEVVRAATADGLGFDPAGFSERGSTTCPLCGASVSLQYAKAEGKAGRMAVSLMAAALLSPGARGKSYVGSRAASRLMPAEGKVGAILANLAGGGLAPPDEPICATDSLNFKVPLYGLSAFGDLFTDR